MKKNRKIAFIIGTRAELIKTFPLMHELKKRKEEYYFIHTGQHSLGNLCDLFSIKRPDIILTKEPQKSSKFNLNKIKAIFWNIVILAKIRKSVKCIGGLDYVIYHGDTMTTASAAIATSRLFNPFKKYKSVHLEGGLRSENLREPFPEEISRKIADYFSDIILAVSKRAYNNVKHYKNKSIYLTGNSVIDSVHIALQKANKIKIKPLSKGKFALITLHRHENLNNEGRLKKIIEILTSLNIKSYFMIHDNTIKQLEKFGLMKELRKNKDIILTRPLDYVAFVYQLSKCSFIICDGGSMQEESLILKKPCIVLRKSTERQEGLETNFQFLSKFDINKTRKKIDEFLSKSFKINKFKNPYGNQGVSAKILEVLKNEY